MSALDTINQLYPEDVAEAIGFFTMKNMKKGMKKIIENQSKLIELTLSSKGNDDEKRVYSVEEIQKILNISRTTAYALIKEAPFRVIHIGNAIRISKADFDKWLDNLDQR